MIKTNHDIKRRATSNDIFITPPEVAKIQIGLHSDVFFNDASLWLDPCCHTLAGSYYSNFIGKKEWCEITMGKCFFDYSGKPDVICGNPPYSLLDQFIEKILVIQPQEFSLLLALHGLTTRRLEIIEKAGFCLVRMKMLKIYKWFGMSAICVFTKGEKPCITYDRKVYR
jgi:hypothetical protein|tara:strand:- start:689 stop:1195 length:507 start_codon:yes stop_codon:yes gene_type:complete